MAVYAPVQKKIHHYRQVRLQRVQDRGIIKTDEAHVTLQVPCATFHLRF